MTNDLLTTQEAAAHLRKDPRTLKNWRCTKKYDLPYIQIGRSVYYRLEDIEHVKKYGLQSTKSKGGTNDL